MPLKERQAAFERIEKARGGRRLVSLCTFDRQADRPIPGIDAALTSDCKEALYRVLKETCAPRCAIDLCVYTRGGDTNSVWPLVSLVREFDVDFEVLVPFRCHSAGTLLALGANRMVLGPMSELSPIDPSTGNQFNPPDPFQQGSRLGISVEDVRAYRDFVFNQLDIGEKLGAETRGSYAGPLQKLVADVHPLALGNVHRVHQQIIILARKLLELHPRKGDKIETVVEALTTKFYSHVHMVNRTEARAILGEDRVHFADSTLVAELDVLLRQYEDDFALRRTFVLPGFMADQPSRDVRFIAGVVESGGWSYVLETTGRWTQYSVVPPNIQVQVPPGQPMPLVPGLRREYAWLPSGHGWCRNREPKGVTV